MRVISANSQEGERLKWRIISERYLALNIFRISNSYKNLTIEEIIFIENKILEGDDLKKYLDESNTRRKCR